MKVIQKVQCSECKVFFLPFTDVYQQDEIFFPTETFRVKINTISQSQIKSLAFLICTVLF